MTSRAGTTSAVWTPELLEGRPKIGSRRPAQKCALPLSRHSARPAQRRLDKSAMDVNRFLSRLSSFIISGAAPAPPAPLPPPPQPRRWRRSPASRLQSNFLARARSRDLVSTRDLDSLARSTTRPKCRRQSLLFQTAKLAAPSGPTTLAVFTREPRLARPAARSRATFDDNNL